MSWMLPGPESSSATTSQAGSVAQVTPSAIWDPQSLHVDRTIAPGNRETSSSEGGDSVVNLEPVGAGGLVSGVGFIGIDG